MDNLTMLAADRELPALPSRNREAVGGDAGLLEKICKTGIVDGLNAAVSEANVTNEFRSRRCPKA
jgi:hypothetical protein